MSYRSIQLRVSHVSSQENYFTAAGQGDVSLRGGGSGGTVHGCDCVKNSSYVALICSFDAARC